MKRVLVTGGTGFIGTNLCLNLLRKGIDVVALDNFVTSSPTNLAQLKKHPLFSFYRHDITMPFSSKLQKKLAGITHIFHLACPTGVSNLQRLSEEMLLTCSIGTRNVLELALSLGARVIFTSSSEVYGNPSVFPQKETYTGNVNTLGFRSPYEEGKRFAESLITMYVRKYDLDARIVRVFNTYGPFMDKNDSRAIPTFIRQIKLGKALPVAGSGKQTRTFCYVDDLISGLLIVMQNGKKGEAYNIGSTKEIRIIELAKILLQLAKSKVGIVFVHRPPHDHARRMPSITKIRQLGFRQSVPLVSGLRKTLQWYGL